VGQDGILPLESAKRPEPCWLRQRGWDALIELCPSVDSSFTALRCFQTGPRSATRPECARKPQTCGRKIAEPFERGAGQSGHLPLQGRRHAASKPLGPLSHPTRHRIARDTPQPECQVKSVAILQGLLPLAVAKPADAAPLRLGKMQGRECRRGTARQRAAFPPWVPQPAGRGSPGWVRVGERRKTCIHP